MNEFPTILRAREFLRDAGNDSVPVDVKRLAAAANAKIKVAYDLADDESGQTTPFKGKHIIFVNGNHKEERQRFTVLHEIAHIVLGLPSQHHGSTLKTEMLLRYARRPRKRCFVMYSLPSVCFPIIRLPVKSLAPTSPWMR